MKYAAGLVLFRRGISGFEVFLVHPGGPYWRNKHAGAWSIPKGLYEPGEAPLAAAQREFHEETGFTADGPFIPLGDFKIRRDKVVTAFAAAGDCAPEKLVSNTFSTEWPPRSDRMRDFPEVDRGGWFGEEEARAKISPGQREILRQFFQGITGQEQGPAHGEAPPAQRRTDRSGAPGRAPPPPTNRK